MTPMVAYAQEKPSSIAARLIRSQWLGDFEWEPDCALFFPVGLPGFEEERRMVPVEIPGRRPLVYLQSLDRPDVCFVALPALIVKADFQLQLSDEDKAALMLPEECVPVLGIDLLCLALLATSGRSVQANLTAPIVINLHNSRGVQSVQRATETATCYRLEENGSWGRQC